MAELLVMRRDKVNPNDVRLDIQCYKRGDVVVVREDGHRWGTKDRTSQNFEILKMPNVSVSAARAFLAREPLEAGDPPDRPRQRRAFTLDVDRGVLRNIFSGDRSSPEHTANLSDAQLLDRRVRKPRRDVPGDIG